MSRQEVWCATLKELSPYIADALLALAVIFGVVSGALGGGLGGTTVAVAAAAALGRRLAPGSDRVEHSKSVPGGPVRHLRRRYIDGNSEVGHVNAAASDQGGTTT